MNYNWKLLKKPNLFQPGNLTLWDDEYIAENVLKRHLNGDIDSGSRQFITIKNTTKWIRKKYPKAYSILDVGCGPGLYAPLLCQYGFEYHGFDISKYQIAYAREHNSFSGKAQFDVCDFRTWESQKKYDIILLLYGIYSFYNYNERVSFLKRIRTSLKDNGCVIIEVFTLNHYRGRKNTTDWEFVEKDGFWSRNPYLELNAFHRFNEEVMLIQAAVINDSVKIWNSWIQVFSPKSIKEELLEAGFTCCEIYGSCYGKPYTLESDVLCICAY